MRPGLSALNHQHFFCVRLDMAVDGHRNDVHEVHTESVPAGPENPYGNAFKAVATALERARRAAADRPAFGPLLAVLNPDRAKHGRRPVAYKLVPGTNVLPFAAEARAAWRAPGS